MSFILIYDRNNTMLVISMKCSTCREEKEGITESQRVCSDCLLTQSQARIRQWHMLTGVQGHSHRDGPVATFPDKRARARQIW